MIDYFTADLHIGHERCATEFRKFDSLEKMNQWILDFVMQTVSQEDRLWILGDFVMNNYKDHEKINKILNYWNIKEVHLIPGNHDNKSLMKEVSKYREENDLSIFVVEDSIVEKRFIPKTKGMKYIPFVCSHYPLSSWSTVSKGVGHIHGHCHQVYQGKGKILDVGIDSYFNGKKGIWSVEDIKNFMDKREIYSVDYH